MGGEWGRARAAKASRRSARTRLATSGGTASCGTFVARPYAGVEISVHPSHPPPPPPPPPPSGACLRVLFAAHASRSGPPGVREDQGHHRVPMPKAMQSQRVRGHGMPPGLLGAVWAPVPLGRRHPPPPSDPRPGSFPLTRCHATGAFSATRRTAETRARAAPHPAPPPPGRVAGGPRWALPSTKAPSKGAWTPSSKTTRKAGRGGIPGGGRGAEGEDDGGAGTRSGSKSTALPLPTVRQGPGSKGRGLNPLGPSHDATPLGSSAVFGWDVCLHMNPGDRSNRRTARESIGPTQ